MTLDIDYGIHKINDEEAVAKTQNVSKWGKMLLKAYYTILN